MRPILLLAFILLTNVCISQTDKKRTVTGSNYKIEYPASWRVDSSRNMGTELIFYSPLDNEEDKFSENVNILIQNLKGRNIDLKKYKQITDGELAELGGDSKTHESSILKSGNIEYYRLVYEMTQDKRKLKFTSVCYIKNEKAYLLTFTSPLTTYDRYKNTGEDILKSFVLTK